MRIENVVFIAFDARQIYEISISSSLRSIDETLHWRRARLVCCERNALSSHRVLRWLHFDQKTINSDGNKEDGRGVKVRRSHSGSDQQDLVYCYMHNKIIIISLHGHNSWHKWYGLCVFGFGNCFMVETRPFATFTNTIPAGILTLAEADVVIADFLIYGKTKLDPEFPFPHRKLSSDANQTEECFYI